MKSALLFALCLLAGSCFAINTAKIVTWNLLNPQNSTDFCQPVAYNGCAYCEGYYYQPYECYGFEECYFNIYSDYLCEDIRQSYVYAGPGDCNNFSGISNDTICSLYWIAPDLDCDGCTAPVFTVQSDAGVSAYHLPFADGPSYVTQTSTTEVSVAGRLSGHYYKDGYGQRIAVEGFLDQDTYLTTAGYCTVGQWCNSTTSMQYKLDFQSVSANLADGNYLGFHPYVATAFGSENYSETPVAVLVPGGDHASFLSVDSDWDLTNFEIQADLLVGSHSGIIPIIRHHPSLSFPSTATYNDMLYIPRGYEEGVLAYNFNIESFEIYRRAFCQREEENNSSVVLPVCYLDGSFPSDNDSFLSNRKQSTDDMTFTLL